MLAVCIAYFRYSFQKVQALQLELNKLLEAKSANFTDGIVVRRISMYGKM